MGRSPQRTCIGCRGVKGKDEVVRLVAGPAGVVIDYRGKLPGRAAYVCPQRECIAKAVQGKALSRSLRRTVALTDEERFTEGLCLAIRDKMRSLIAMAAKAGRLASGTSAVTDALEKGRIELLVFAEDLSAGTREQFPADAGVSRRVTFSTRSELGALVGRELVGVMAITDKGLADALMREAERLKGLINEE